MTGPSPPGYVARYDGRQAPLELRIADLKERRRDRTVIFNVAVPTETVARIDELARRLKATKTAVIIALLNAGLAVARKR